MMLHNCNTEPRPAQSAAMVDWDDFKFFSAVAHAGSVRGAGKRLGVHASTVTRRLEQFEQRLGIRLFVRTGSGLLITPEGAEVVQTLDDVATRLENIERRLRGRDSNMAGLVRINIPEAFLGELFMAEIAGFSAQHPDITVEVGRAWVAPDLDKRAGDLAIVVSDDPPGHLIGRPLGHIILAGYAHLDAAAEGRGDAQRWLTSALERAVAPDFAARAFPDRPVAGYLGSVELQLVALAAGMGSSLLPRYVGDRHSQLRRLPAAAGVAAEVRRAVWLLSHPDSRGVARVQAVAALLIEVLRGRSLGADQATDQIIDPEH